LRYVTIRGITWGDYVRKLTILLVLLTCTFALAQDAKTAPAATNNNLPIHLGIIMRASKTTFSWQQSAATELVKQLVHEGDEAFVISAGGDRPWPYERLDWNNSPDSLAKFIKGLDKNAGMPEPFKLTIESTSTSENRQYLTKWEGSAPETSAFAIAAAMMKSDPKPAHRVIVMFRDPWDHCPGWGSSYAQFVEQRHDFVVQLLKSSGAEIYIIGIEDVSTRPQMPSEIGTSYGATQSNDSGGYLRQLDEQVRREMNFLLAAGRKNMERLAKENGGEVAYGTKKNYSDAVPVLVSKISQPNTSTSVGK